MTKRSILAIAVLTAVFLSGCIHKDFDEPPAGGSNPDIDADLIVTIADLKALYDGGDAVEITDSIFITGIVTADDESGNYYQTIVFQDESAGISLRLETTSYFNIYPIGRRIYVMLKGLALGNYGDLVQLGVIDPDVADGVARIPNFLVPDHIIPGQYGLTVEPEVVTIDMFKPVSNPNRYAYQNMLVQFENVEFGTEELGETYATDPDISSAVNRNIYDCSGESILLRSSSYSSFALEAIPEGNGTLTAIFSVYNSDDQLLIRDPSDVMFDNELRCADQPIVCDPQDAVTGAFEDFESAELFEPIDINGFKSISVVGNEPYEARDFSGNTYAQVQGHNADASNLETWLVSPKFDLDSVDAFSFISKIGYWVHDGLKVFISTDFDGCNVNLATWEELTSAVIANSVNSPDGIGAYSSNFINSGTVDLSMYSGKAFIGFQYIGNNSDETTTYQLDNIQIGTPPPVICDVTGINEDFESISTSGAFSLDCWQNIATVGNELWDGRSFSGNRYPQVSGFNSPSNDIETYLITPPIDLSGVTTLNFDSKAGYCNHEGLTVYISTDYDGVDPTGATWTELGSAAIANSDCTGQYAANFTNSGDVDISGFSGTGYIAFVYRGNNNDETTTYQIDNVVVD